MYDHIVDEDAFEVLKDVRTHAPDWPRCAGKLVLHRDTDYRPFIQCEKRVPGNHAHLFIRNLGQFDLEYLKALLHNDTQRLLSIESAATLEGYGPLTPCNFTANCSEQKTLCPTWHRDSQGILRRFTLRRSLKCPAKFEFFTPDLTSTPWVVLVCQNPHNHPQPIPSSTPKAIVKVFNNLLKDLDWRLADLTPRKLILDAGFISDLRHILGWTSI
ncbi:hypothetical protein M422DRAFT_248087 [Sphaerobolus stellatus SS14]|nr:hypothetical protein M422DRAFT_248087 [Sphaerobolus stellatus SS14]